MQFRHILFTQEHVKDNLHLTHQTTIYAFFRSSTFSGVNVKNEQASDDNSDENGLGLI